MRSFYLKRVFILSLICAALFLLGNNLFSLSNPDEVFYSLTAHEMVAHHEWMTPMIFDHPQFEKPPLTYWLLEIAFKTWGESPFTARLFPAIFATLGVIAIYLLGLMGFRDERKAFLSALILATSGFYAAMGKTVFTDMIFAVFILFAFTSFVLAYTDRRHKALGLIGFYVFCGLATLTKTPLAFLIAQLAVLLVLLYQRQLSFLKSGWVLLGLGLYLIVALPWYVYMYQQYGHAFVDEFFYNDHWRRLLTAEHKGSDHWFFYPVTMICGLFPWSLFLVASWVDLFKRLKSSVTMMDYLSFSWMVMVFLVFQIAHSKLASYILPLFPALALMTGNFLGNELLLIQHRRKMQNLLWASFGILAVLGVVAVAGQKLCLHYISSVVPLYFLSACLLVLAGIGASLTFKERFYGALYVLALTLVPVFMTAFMIRSDLEKYISSHESSEYIPSRSIEAMTVLTSKENARGIRYYTGQDVAVLDYSDKPFFSPHPIPILNTTDEITNLLNSQPVTIGVVRKAAYNDLLKNFSNHYHVQLLKNLGFEYVVRIQALKAPMVK